MKKTDFFLGATSPNGFHGYFSELAARPGIQMYLIKSGPGCGKSSMMKKLAQAADCDLIHIHCSSDPDSLDGVIFDGKAAIVDATAPHTLEPAAPGAGEEVVSLFHTLDCNALHTHQGEVFELFRRCACLQDRAARCFAGAVGLLMDSRRTAAHAADFEAVRAFAEGFSRRHIPRTGDEAKEETYLLSALTPKGILIYDHSVSTLAKKIVVLQDEYGAASRVILEKLRQDALSRGHHIITCRCCTAPEEKIDHLIFPELGLAVVTGNSWHPLRLEHSRRIHCSRFLDSGMLRRSRTRLRFNHKAAAELLNEASKMQREAHAAHDELEVFYKNAVNFAAVDEMTRRVAEHLDIQLP